MIQFFVPGLPKTAGSKRAFMRPGMKFPVVVEACKGSKDWRGDCKAAARHFQPAALLTGPLKVTLDFRLPRPKSHYCTGKNAAILRNGAPQHHIGKPDVLKMARAVEDSLTGVIWRDDSQIVDEHIVKGYYEIPGCNVTIIEL